MMYKKNYEEFKKQVEKDTKTYILENYPDAEVTCKTIHSLNDDMDGIFIRIKDSGPVLYVKELYHNYCMAEDYDIFLSNLLESVAISMSRNDSHSEIAKDIISNFDTNKIGICLINKNRNEEFLKNLPHRDFLDLAIVYKYFVEDGVEFFITNAICEDQSLNEEQLYQLGMKNTRQLYDLRFTSMYARLRSQFLLNNMLLDMLESMLGTPDDPNISEWILYSNEDHYGPAGLLYEDILDAISKIFHGGFYICPSSIYECLLCDRTTDPYLLQRTILEVNDMELPSSDFLSDSLYFYNTETKRIEIVE